MEQDPSVREFYTFWQKNQLHLVIPKQHRLLRWKLIVWRQEVQRFGNETLTEFADLFAKNLRHISYAQFWKKLSEVATDIVKRIHEQNPKRVILYIPGPVTKSNTWVALLAWPILKSVVTEVQYQKCKISEQPNDGVFVIYPDDMAYSGSQILLNTASCKHTFYLLVPFMSKFAYDSLQRFDISPLTELIDTLETLGMSPGNPFEAKEFQKKLRKDPDFAEDFFEQLANEAEEQDESEPGIGCDDDMIAILYQFSRRQSLVFFDHKLADNVSVPSALIRNGYVKDPETLLTKKKYNFIEEGPIKTFYKKIPYAAIPGGYPDY